tara:strand:- start:115 stop:516 length:402 start_codon:yes stop_codon:yes gene_type:complete
MHIGHDTIPTNTILKSTKWKFNLPKETYNLPVRSLLIVHPLLKLKKSKIPVTRVKKPEPSKDSPDWIIWAAWADRITFEEIRKVTGLSEGQVINHMRKSLKPSSFRLWRKRASTQSIKHQKLFRNRRKEYFDD